MYMMQCPITTSFDRFPFRGYITQKRRKRFSSSFKETMALKLGFHKEDGVGKSYCTDATNASFLFLLDLVGKDAQDS
jgi:hypothetical protein